VFGYPDETLSLYITWKITASGVPHGKVFVNYLKFYRRIKTAKARYVVRCDRGKTINNGQCHPGNYQIKSHRMSPLTQVRRVRCRKFDWIVKMQQKRQNEGGKGAKYKGSPKPKQFRSVLNFLPFILVLN